MINKTILIRKENPSIEEEKDKRDTSIGHTLSKNYLAIKQCLVDSINTLGNNSFEDGVTSDVLVPDLSPYEFSDGRALGAVMIKLQKRGYLQPTDCFRLSTRKASHCRPQRVYLKL
jgi:hypothetical protein